MKDDNNFSTNSLINKSENDLIESLLTSDTHINNYKNKIELIQKLSDGKIIVISRKTEEKYDSSSQNKIKNITTINIIEEFHHSEKEEDETENAKIKENDEVVKIHQKEFLKFKRVRRRTEIKKFKRGEKKLVTRKNSRNKKSQNKFDFRIEMNKNKINLPNINISKNINSLFTELKPLNESDLFETNPDSVKQFDVHSILDSVNENQKVRITRSRINKSRNNLYFLSHLNDVKNLNSLRLKFTDKMFPNK